MSTKPKPRPKPRAKVSNGASSGDPAPSYSSSKLKDLSSGAKSVDTSVDDFFMRCNPRGSAAKAARLEELESEAAQSAPRHTHDSDHDDDDDDTQSSGGKRRRREMGLPMAPSMKKLPSWTHTMGRKLSIPKSDTDDDVVIEISSGADEDEEDEDVPKSKRARSTTADKQVYREAAKKEKRRQKIRSPSITPPPEVTAIERQKARQLYNDHLPASTRRPSSPDPFLDADTSSSSLLNPELRNIAAKIKSGAMPKKTLDPALSGRPEVVVVTVVYHPHSNDPLGAKEQEWKFRLKRTQDFKIVFERVAEQLGLPVNRIKLCYKQEEVFKFISPNNLEGIWAEAELDAYLDTTLAFLRANRLTAPSEPVAAADPSHGASLSIQPAGTQPSKPATSTDEAEDDTNDILSIFIQHRGKKVPVKTRPTTDAMKLVKHFVKVATGEDMSEAEIRKKNIRLKCDGEDVPYDTTCAAMNDGDGLEDEDCLDVVGL